MFPSVSTPVSQTRSGTWPRYNSSPSTQNPAFPQLDSLFPHTPVTPQSASYLLDFHPSRPTLSSPILIKYGAEGLQTPQRQNQRFSAPPTFDTPMSDYHNTPSPQAYGINGLEGLRSTGGDFMSKSLSTPSSRPILRPSQSQNAVPDTPTPAQNATWPRRTMTDIGLMGRNQRPSSTGTICVPTPSVVTPITFATVHEADNSASTPYQLQHLSLSTSTHSVPQPQPQSQSQAQSQAQAQPQPHPQSQFNQPPHPPHGHLAPSYSNYNDDLSAYTSYQGTYEGSYGATPWQSHPPPDYHHHMPAYYHHPGLPPMQAPYKQDEPILAPGEIPAPRPPNSYAALIGEALLLAPPPHQLYVSEISESVKRRYTYYRQNPSKIYNGVRHQTSMCKAFVKLPRPFGDQSGGARKWAIRAGCEGWFLNGGYNPPGTVSPPVKGGKGTIGKAKSTARTKALVIGTGRRLSDKTDDSTTPTTDSFSQGGGPSVGPAWDPSRSAYPHPLGAQYQQTNNTYSYPTPAPGYHYVPISHPHPPSQPMTYSQSYPYYSSYWPHAPYSNPTPISPVQYASSAPPGASNSPLSSPAQQWRGSMGSENGREHEYNQVVDTRRPLSADSSNHTYDVQPQQQPISRSPHSSHGPSPSRYE